MNNQTLYERLVKRRFDEEQLAKITIRQYQKARKEENTILAMRSLQEIPRIEARIKLINELLD